MASSRPDRRLSEIAANPTFRTIDGVSIRFVESDALVNAWWAGGFKTCMKTSTTIAAGS